MLTGNEHQYPHPACYLVPGFAYYNGIGERLAADMLDFFDLITDLIGAIRVRLRPVDPADRSLSRR